LATPVLNIIHFTVSSASNFFTEASVCKNTGTAPLTTNNIGHVAVTETRQYCNIPTFVPFIAKGYEGAYIRGRIRFLKEATTKRNRNRYVHMTMEHKTQEK
jgi:hypothetical protein